MNRKLWTVLSDQQPVAVVAAEAMDSAWKIVSALAEHHDLPRQSRQTQVIPCPPRQHRETLSQADDLGCRDSFLACIRGGMFLTHIEGLALG